MISGLHSVGKNAVGSSSAPRAISASKFVGELLSEFAPVTAVVCIFFLIGFVTSFASSLLC